MACARARREEEQKSKMRGEESHKIKGVGSLQAVGWRRGVYKVVWAGVRVKGERGGGKEVTRWSKYTDKNAAERCAV